MNKSDGRYNQSIQAARSLSNNHPLQVNGEPAYVAETWMGTPGWRSRVKFHKVPELMSLRFKELDALIASGKGDKPSIRIKVKP